MKVAIIGSPAPDSMESNFKEALEHRGDECRIFDIYDSRWFKVGALKKWTTKADELLRAYSDGYDRRVFRRVGNAVCAFAPELVICFYRFIHPSMVARLKTDLQCPVIHVNPDAITTFQYQQVFAADYDVWFTKDRFIRDFMCDKMKLNAKLYTEAFNARLHKVPDMSKEQCEQEVGIDVMTYGTMYPYRCRMIKRVMEAGIDVKLFGVRPGRFYDHALDKAFTGKYLVGEEKARVLYGAKIVFNQMHYAEIEGVNERFVEANGMGAFQLCDYKPVLQDLLPVAPELVSFRTIDEGIEKLRHYLQHPQERYDIAARVQRHFAEHYTYDHLIRHILNSL